MFDGPATFAHSPQPISKNPLMTDVCDIGIASDWLPGMAAVLFDRSDHGQVLWCPIMVVDIETVREMVSSSEVEGLIPVLKGIDYS